MPSFSRLVPTPDEQIAGFFELVTLTGADVVYDLGSGDGRLLFAALERGAGKAVGVELNPDFVREAAETARRKGAQDRVTLITGDVMEVNLAGASVVLCYLSRDAPGELKPKFAAELKAGAQIVMEMYPVPGWKPVRTTDKGGKRFYLYVMPPEPGPEEAGGDPLLDYLYPPSPAK